jgi:1,6-anhydro-N-acetylmuramate kinase
VHGQTVFHKPPVSWQMLTPSVIAHALGAPVVCDLRAADLAAGGQGAPMTPIADWVFFRGDGSRTAIVNLGGFCNITLLGGGGIESIAGSDVCPCNQLLDAIARKLFFVPYDESGGRAAAGQVHEESLGDLEGILAAQRSGRRSLGTGDEALEWLSRWRAHVRAEDLGATACEGIGHAIAVAVGDASRVLLAGGGAKNAALVSAIRGNATAPVAVLEGGLAEYREAAAMSVLGALSRDRVAVTLPRVTGVAEPAPVAGVWVFP